MSWLVALKIEGRLAGAILSCPKRSSRTVLVVAVVKDETRDNLGAAKSASKFVWTDAPPGLEKVRASTLLVAYGGAKP